MSLCSVGIVVLSFLEGKIMVKKPTIKELEEQMFDLTLQIEHLRNEYHVLKAENNELKSKLDRIAGSIWH